MNILHDTRFFEQHSHTCFHNCPDFAQAELFVYYLRVGLTPEFELQVGQPNPPTDVTVKIRIGPFLPVYQMSAQSHNIDV